MNIFEAIIAQDAAAVRVALTDDPEAVNQADDEHRKPFKHCRANMPAFTRADAGSNASHCDCKIKARVKGSKASLAGGRSSQTCALSVVSL